MNRYKQKYPLKPPIVYSGGTVTLLGAGLCQGEDLESGLSVAPELVCVDGGVNTAWKAGMQPRIVIGDMDSADPEVLAHWPEIPVVKIEDQDTTDFEKALQRIRCEILVGLGFLGQRLDHQLAALSVLARYPHQRVILVGEQDICLRCPSRIAMELPVGTRVSLFPMSDAVGASRGLFWPLDGIALSPVGMIATSNRTVKKTIEINLQSGSAILILPKQHLGPVFRALHDLT